MLPIIAVGGEWTLERSVVHTLNHTWNHVQGGVTLSNRFFSYRGHIGRQLAGSTGRGVVKSLTC